MKVFRMIGANNLLFFRNLRNDLFHKKTTCFQTGQTRFYFEFPSNKEDPFVYVTIKKDINQKLLLPHLPWPLTKKEIQDKDKPIQFSSLAKNIFKLIRMNPDKKLSHYYKQLFTRSCILAGKMFLFFDHNSSSLECYNS